MTDFSGKYFTCFRSNIHVSLLKAIYFYFTTNGRNLNVCDQHVTRVHVNILQGFV